MIEDAHVGLEAVRRAGMATLAIATTNPLAALQYAAAAVESLASVTLDFLLSIRNSQARDNAASWHGCPSFSFYLF